MMLETRDYPCGCVVQFIWDGNDPTVRADARKKPVFFCEDHAPPELLKARKDAGLEP